MATPAPYWARTSREHPSGDTGVYVWNLWVFRHEIEQGRLPFYTSSILSVPGDAGGPSNLSLHNYTTFANLIAYPLIPHFGLVAAFNLIYLRTSWLAGYCMFLLARHFAGQSVEAWLAGALFVASPVLVARGAGHFSLVAAAPLPLFVAARAARGDDRPAALRLAAGATVAWATFCDAYYGVFCVMLGGFTLLAHLVDVRRAAALPARAGRCAIHSTSCCSSSPASSSAWRSAAADRCCSSASASACARCTRRCSC